MKTKLIRWFGAFTGLPFSIAPTLATPFQPGRTSIAVPPETSPVGIMKTLNCICIMFTRILSSFRDDFFSMPVRFDRPGGWYPPLPIAFVLLCLLIGSGTARAQTYGHDPTDPMAEQKSGAATSSQLIILSNYGLATPDMLAGTGLSSGYITAVKFYGAPSYNFSLLVLLPAPGVEEELEEENNFPSADLAFGVLDGAPAPESLFSGPAATTAPGVQTLSGFGNNLPVHEDCCLAFLGTGPYYWADSTRAAGDDATYQYATPANPPLTDVDDPLGGYLFGASMYDLAHGIYTYPSALAGSLTPVPVTQPLGAYAAFADGGYYPFFAVGGNGASQAPYLPQTFQYVPDSPAGTQARVYLIEVDISANPEPQPTLTLTLQGNALPGQPATCQVTTSDGSSPLVTFSSSDPTALLPASVQLVNGSATFSAVFDTPGSQPTLTVSSAAGEAYSYASDTIPVEVSCPTITVTPTGIALPSGAPPAAVTLPAGTVGASYATQGFVALGGSVPYTIAYSFLDSAGAPAGLAFPAGEGSDSFSSIISGTPQTAGTYTFTITATDAYGCTSADPTVYTLVVNPTPPSAPTANPEGVATLDSPGGVFTLTGSDPNNLPLTYTVPVNTANGGQLREDDPGWAPASVINGTYSIQWAKTNGANSIAPTLKYAPPDHPGGDDFTFTVYNGTASSPPATVDLAIASSGSSLTTPGSSVGGNTATLTPGSSGRAVAVIAFPSNPNGTAASFGGPAAYAGLSVLPATAGNPAALQATFYYPNYPGYPNSAVPSDLLYYPAGGPQWLYVVDNQGNQVPPVSDPTINGYSYTVNLNDQLSGGSSPAIYQLAGTDFAMGTLAPASVNFENLSSQAITYGTPSVTLTGRVIGQNGVAPNELDFITASISGFAVNGVPYQVTFTGEFVDDAGDFSIPCNFSFPLPVTGSPLPITCVYSGDSALYLEPGENTATTLTVNPEPVTVTAPSYTIISGAAGLAPVLSSSAATCLPASTAAALENNLTLSYEDSSGNPVTTPDTTQPGVYKIVAAGTSPDYLLTFVNGVLLVEPAGTTQIASTQVAGGGSATVQVPVTGQQSGVIATVTDNGSTAETIAAAAYTGDPVTGDTTFGAGTASTATFIDLEAPEATAADSLTAYFNFPPGASPAALYYYVGPGTGPDAWSQVLSDGPYTSPPDNPYPPVNNNGSFEVIFDANSTPSITELQGSVFALGTPYVPGPPVAANSTLSPATATLVANGLNTQVITVQARDANSIDVPGGGAAVVFSLAGVGSLSGTTDNGDGTYSAVLTSPTTTGTATVSATLNGSPVGTVVAAASSVTTFVPGPPSAANSTLGPATASLAGDGVSTETITVQARDAKNNNLTAGGAIIAFSLAGVGTLSGTTDHGDGTYSATLRSPPTAGTATVTATLNGSSVGTAVSASFSVTTFSALSTTARWEGPGLVNDGVILITASPTTAWTAMANVSWLHFSGGKPNDAGTGSASVVFSCDTNPGTTRSGTLTIAGQTVTVTQAGSTYRPVTALTILAGFFEGSGIDDPTSVAVDGSGNVFIGDNDYDAVFELPAGSTTLTTLVTTNTGLGNPQGLAVDTSGNLYIADGGTSDSGINGKYAIEEFPAGSPPLTPLTTLATQSSGLGDPQGVAVDTSGNLYIADGYAYNNYSSQNDAVEELAPGAASVTTLASQASGLSNPLHVAVDLLGNLFISDNGGNAIDEFPAGSLPGGPLTTLENVPNPAGVAVDVGDNLYIANGGANQIEEVPAGSAPLAPWNTLVYPGNDPSLLAFPSGVAVDSSGNVFIADWGWGQVEELPHAFVDPTPVTESPAAGSDSLPAVLPTTINLTAQFAPSTDAASSSWLSLTGTANGVVSFSFTANPGFPRTGFITVLGQTVSVTQTGPDTATLGSTSRLEGPASGGDSVILLVNPSSATWTATANDSWLNVTTPSGTGSTTVLFACSANSGATRTGTLSIAGQTVTVTQAGSTYSPVTSVTPIASSSDPTSVAVDGFGNVFYNDLQNLAVDELPAAGGSPVTVANVTSGLGNPSGLAVDAAGNLFISDGGNSAYNPSRGNNAIEEFPAGSPPLTPLTTLATQSSGLGDPLGVAVDASGNLYIADGYSPSNPAFQNDALEELPAGGSSFNVLASATTGLVNPQYVAVDLLGNLFIGDGGGTIDEYPAGSAPGAPLVTLANLGVNDGSGGVAVDGADNLYFSNVGTVEVEEFPAGIAPLAPWTTLAKSASGLSNPQGVAVDSAGDVFIADAGTDQIEELPHAFVDPTSRMESPVAGSDSLPVVLPATVNLTGPFAPTTDSASSSWLSLTGTSGGVVSFSFTANPGPARTGYITVLGQTIPVTQASMAAATLGTTSRIEGPGAGADSVILLLNPSSATWTAIANDSWLTVTTPSGTGNATVLFTYAANSGPTRTSFLTIAGQTLAITQAGSTYSPVTSVTPIASSSDPTSLAVDASGDVFYGDVFNDVVNELPAGSTSSTTIASASSGLGVPQSLAVDQSGNLYIADGGADDNGTPGNYAIEEFLAGNSPGSPLTTLAGQSAGLGDPLGVAVDTSGNIYLADGSTYNNSTYQNDAVEVFPAGGASVTVLANSAAGLVNPQYVAVDLLGNLFIADNGGGTVDEYTAGSPPGAPLVTLENLSVNSPSGVAVDGGDNLFFGNAGPDEVEEFPAGTAPLAPFTTVVNSASGMVASTAEAVDSAGDLFIADWKAGQVEELPHAFVDQTPRAETSAAGSDSLPPVVPTTANLTGPFAPTTDAGSSAWLSITGVSGGVVSYSFTANTGPARTGYITVLGLTIPVTQSSPLYFGHSLYNTPQGPDGSPPLVILGEYDSAGPLQTSSVTLPNGTISDVKFYGGAYNFTVYVLQPLGLGANPNEQSFQVTASESFSGNAPVGIQTLPATGLPVAAGDLLAFAGVGPYYNGNESDALNTDATYGDASNPGAFSATAPGGTGAVFTVGLNSDPNVNYDYVPDVFGNQGRIYSFGVDVSETPVAAPYTILRAAGLPLHIFWSNVQANWSNPDGNPMTLTPFNPVSFQGVNLLENSAQILYPGTAPNVNDEINYTITDNYGETASGVINVVIINPFGQTGQLTTALTINNGNATVSFYGIIGLTYEIQRSTDLVNWVTIDTATVGSGGQITFIDTFPGLPSPPASAYYRLAWQP